MSSIISMEEMAQIIREQYAAGGEKVSFTPRGVSMLPMLRDNLDKVVLEKPKDRLKKYDLPLFQRDNGSFILHRVVGVEEDGTYDMCGDNQINIEKGIRHDQIIGVVTSFERMGKWYQCTDISYRIYVRIRVASIPCRKLKARGIRYSKRVVNKLKRMIKR